MRINRNTTIKSADQVLREGFLVKGEPFSRVFAGSALPLTTQQVMFVAVGLRAGDQITGVACNAQGNAAALTLAKVGLYDAAGNRVAVSASVHGTWPTAAETLVQTPFTAVYTVPADGLYYLAILLVGTTPGGVFGVGGRQVGNAALSGGKIAAGGQTGQADLPVSATIAANPNALWLAAY